MTHTDETLMPCPFCGAGITHIRENGKLWTGQRYSDPTSVSVLHHCEPVDGQPSLVIERVGRDMESAVAAWNRRAPAPQAQRVPLSKSEVDGLLESAGYLYNDNTRADFIGGIRYAEAHHGITQEK